MNLSAITSSVLIGISAFAVVALFSHVQRGETAFHTKSAAQAQNTLILSSVSRQFERRAKDRETLAGVTANGEVYAVGFELPVWPNLAGSTKHQFRILQSDSGAWTVTSRCEPIPGVSVAQPPLKDTSIWAAPTHLKCADAYQLKCNVGEYSVVQIKDIDGNGQIISERTFPNEAPSEKKGGIFSSAVCITVEAPLQQTSSYDGILTVGGSIQVEVATTYRRLGGNVGVAIDKTTLYTQVTQNEIQFH